MKILLHNYNKLTLHNTVQSRVEVTGVLAFRKIRRVLQIQCTRCRDIFVLPQVQTFNFYMTLVISLYIYGTIQGIEDSYLSQPLRR